MQLTPKAVPMGVYVPGTSAIHRLPAGIKLGLILLFIIATVVFRRRPEAAVTAALVVIICYLWARIPLSVAWSQFYPPLIFILWLAALQWWQNDFLTAATMAAMLLCAVMAAMLLTLTSTVAEILDSINAILAPLAKIGFPAQTVSLAISLTLRLIPLQFSTLGEVRDARRARGVALTASAFGTPVVVRSIRRARSIGEALAARGVAD